ncbi:MAG: arsenite efflux transporter metallochaperone ArsD [Gorillibacterium sp.]|nr:arsenite efflux transporter metallochaperone ArsD [Gorillibacterium sp.]
MKQVDIYDPAMCCSTGVCGPGVDPQLIQAAADLEKLKKLGVMVNRYNLSQDLDAFASNETVKSLLASGGTNVLPITIVSGEVCKKGAYPSYEELMTWLDHGKIPLSAKRPFIKSIETAPSDGGCCGGSGSSCC